jgi:hypothetical protein
MALRTVRLDDEAEDALREVRSATGLPISEALKRGLRVLRDQVRHGANERPYDIYQTLDLGAGGYAIAPARTAKAAVKKAIAKKHKR